jgi:serine/threonine protein kinase
MLMGLQGMLFLHSRRQQILHRDLKSPNLLVDKHWHCKIADFNLSKIMDSLDRRGSSSFTSENPRWLAPEVRIAPPGMPGWQPLSVVVATSPSFSQNSSFLEAHPSWVLDGGILLAPGCSPPF